jgi:hypothetical protein
MNLLFVPETHKYYLDGEEIPSVTTVIKNAGLMPSYKTNDGGQAMQYGTLVHEACAKYLTDYSLPSDPFVMFAMAGFCSWCAEYDPEPLLIEQKMANEKIRVAGTLDLVAKSKDVKWLIDIKTGDFHPWHIIQLSAYDRMLHGTPNKPDRWACLYLSCDDKTKGKYTFKPFSKAEIISAYSAFLNAHNLTIWRKNHGI